MHASAAAGSLNARLGRSWLNKCAPLPQVGRGFAARAAEPRRGVVGLTCRGGRTASGAAARAAGTRRIGNQNALLQRTPNSPNQRTAGGTWPGRCVEDVMSCRPRNRWLGHISKEAKCSALVRSNGIGRLADHTYLNVRREYTASRRVIRNRLFLSCSVEQVVFKLFACCGAGTGLSCF